ncbi:MAG: ferritin-like fold-containing protein [Marmoricola sp.]
MASLLPSERLVEDAKLATDLHDKLALGKMAKVQFDHIEPLLDRINALGVDPALAMQPFVASFDDFHAKTAPRDRRKG